MGKGCFIRFIRGMKSPFFEFEFKFLFSGIVNSAFQSKYPVRHFSRICFFSCCPIHIHLCIKTIKVMKNGSLWDCRKCYRSHLSFPVMRNQHVLEKKDLFFLNPIIILIPMIISNGKMRAAKIPIFRLSFNTPEIIPT